MTAAYLPIVRDPHIGRCPYPEESGYETVSVVDRYCEVGCGCVERCSFSWPASDEVSTAAANDAFEEAYL
jgi:hypothetical protein